jgi:hypothetical protein
MVAAVAVVGGEDEVAAVVVAADTGGTARISARGDRVSVVSSFLRKRQGSRKKHRERQALRAGTYVVAKATTP